MPTNTDPTSVVAFWREAGPERWFAKDDAFDADFRQRFMDLHLAVAARAHDDWLATAEGALALVILTDQFPRNCFRGTAHMYTTDPLARLYAREALDRGYKAQVDPALQQFLCLPFEHSEDLADQDHSVALHMGLGEEAERYAAHHRDIIRRFGRFPHRNAILGRTSTAEEQAFLDAGGFNG
ncbi:DUF924 family protein [Zavarzinia sp. CC-PAN008]|uniref:DUF924 family protein n=1 Tax=Zavarzinia sp. CC-PAN008 TaxID=3243332 RepID=UPI003F7451AD